MKLTNGDFVQEQENVRSCDQCVRRTAPREFECAPQFGGAATFVDHQRIYGSSNSTSVTIFLCTLALVAGMVLTQVTPVKQLIERLTGKTTGV